MREDVEKTKTAGRDASGPVDSGKCNVDFHVCVY